MRLAGIVALGAFSGMGWAIGCTGLSGDCELNLTCPPVTTSATFTITTSTTTDPPKCSDIFEPGPCNSCLQEECCQEVAECVSDFTCISYCVFGVWPLPPECSVPETTALLEAFSGCLNAKCLPACAPTDYCHPITNAPCNTDKTACDLVYPGTFVCLPPGEPAVPLCGACDNEVGPYCAGGLRCHQPSNTCARFCCDDGDCGTGKCVLDQEAVFGAPLAISTDVVGLCLDQAGATAACDAPMVAPSNGACFFGFVR